MAIEYKIASMHVEFLIKKAKSMSNSFDTESGNDSILK